MIGGSSPGRGWEFFYSPPRPERLWGSPSLLPNGYQGLFHCGIKRRVCEADHPLPSSAEVQNAWSFTSTPQYAFMAWCSVKKKHRDNWQIWRVHWHPIYKMQKKVKTTQNVHMYIDTKKALSCYMTDPSSRQGERPMKTRPLLSWLESKSGDKPRGDQRQDGRTDWLTDRLTDRLL
jgi:hypothetical protein